MIATQMLLEAGCEYVGDAHAERVAESEGGKDKSSARNASSTPPSPPSAYAQQLSMR